VNRGALLAWGEGLLPAVNRSFAVRAGPAAIATLHEAISQPRRNLAETEGIEGAGIEHGGCHMLVLMNLIWRRLAHTMLAGMRSKLVRQ
jgi:hypothetical protein